jgi:drug/metabolite transporter (DMT)-like permease
MDGLHPILASAASQQIGVALALMTAVFWAISPLCWASVGQRIGSFSVLLLRGLLASTMLLLLLLPVYVLLRGGTIPLPSSAQLWWILLSGIAGMAIGDALYYEALVTLGPRRTTQILTLAPVAAVALGWMYLDEQLNALRLMGIVTVLAATAYAVLARQRATRQETDRPTDTNIASPSGNTLAPQNGVATEVNHSSKPHEPGYVTAAGIAFAVAGAVCVGLGAVTMRQAFRVGELDMVFATVLRVASSTCLLWLIPLFRGRVMSTIRPLADGFILPRVLLGTLAGPLLGMLCYVGAIKYIEAGIASTLTSMSPLFILPLIAMRYQAKLTWRIAIATALASAGVGLIFLG